MPYTVIEYAVFYSRRPYESIVGKLIFGTGVILFSGSLITGFLFFKFSAGIMMRNLRLHGHATADLVRKDINYAMLTAHYDSMQETLEALAYPEDILDIKVFAPDRRIVFASTPSELGNEVKLTTAVAKALSGAEPAPETTAWDEGKKIVIPGYPPLAANGRKALNFYLPIRNGPSCYTASCHVHAKDEKVLGVLLTSFSTMSIETTRKQMFKGTLLFGSLGVLSASGVLIAIFYQFILRPMAQLDEGMARIAGGDFETPVDIRSRDEMGLLAKTFNAMAADIKRYRDNMENWTRSLQEEVEKKTAEMIQAQEQIIKAEKLASLGRMAAGVAHELDSPLNNIMTSAHLLRDRILPDRKQDREDTELVIRQAERCATVIKGMLGFAKKGVSEATKIDVNTPLLATVALLAHHVNIHNVKIDTDLAMDLPPVAIDPIQLQQVFLNLITNAVDAIGYAGFIHIATRVKGLKPERTVEIEFTDTGSGIYPNNLDKIFEPFFTTKPMGKGTGLGLPVSYGIIKKHGGDIVVKSQVDEGSSFFVRLPESREDEGTASSGGGQKEG